MADTGFERPTLAQLVTRVGQDLENRVAGLDTRFRGTWSWALTRVVAAGAYLLHQHLAWIARQVLPDTAEAASLDRHAAIWGLTRRGAGRAVGNVTVAGTSGSEIPAGAILRRQDGVEYRVTADGAGTLGGGGTLTVEVEAVEPGDAGNAAEGVVLTFVSPIAGVTSATTVLAPGIADGVDAETDDALRTRILARIASPPQGGSEADYIAWAREVAGVDQVWVAPGAEGAGTVRVRFSMEVETDDDDLDRIPGSAKVDEVQAYLDEVAPVTATVYVAAPAAQAVDFEVSVFPDTAEVQAAVEAELKALLRRAGGPGLTINNSVIRAAISAAEGEQHHTLVSPAGDIVSSASQLPVMGTVTFS